MGAYSPRYEVELIETRSFNVQIKHLRQVRRSPKIHVRRINDRDSPRYKR
jgi:hypothetical protein